MIFTSNWLFKTKDNQKSIKTEFKIEDNELYPLNDRYSFVLPI